MPNPSAIRNFPPAVALVASLAALGAGLYWGTFAAGGSDSSCYLNQARLFASGTTRIEQPLVIEAPWPRADWTFAPAGHIPSPVHHGSLVPMCPPGLPILMTAAQAVRATPFAIVPLCGAFAVWLTFLLGRQIDSAATGAAAAVLLASSPIFLFQVVQPMSDVPAAAFWLLATWLVLRGNAMGAGLAASMAILIRPNLVPLAVVIGVYVVAQAFPGPRPSTSSGRASMGAVAWFLVGLIPGVATLAALQFVMYGSPVATGYGAPGELFKAAHVLPNLGRYVRWLMQGHTPIVVLSLAAPFLAVRRTDAWLCLSLAVTTLAVYMPYLVFDDWSYVRFLLPAIPLVIVLFLIPFSRVIGQISQRWHAVLFAMLVATLAASSMQKARHFRAFELQSLERHFIDAGTYAAASLPPRAAVLTVRHSGSVQYYSRRPTVSWDTLAPGSLNRTLFFLNSRGLAPMFMLDVAEEADFRARFRASAAGQLDWPPIARVGRTIRVYDPADRARYLAGARIDTIDWPPRQP